MSLYKEYSAKAVNISWNSVPFVGLDENTFLRLTRHSDIRSRVVGAQGDVALTKYADRTGTIEITLMQTSPTNDVLSAIMVAQEAVDFEGTQVSNFIITDPSGSVMATGINAWLEKAPEISLGKDQNPKTWTFGCELLEFTSAIGAA